MIATELAPLYSYTLSMMGVMMMAFMLMCMMDPVTRLGAVIGSADER
jgi:uncharacterized membrane protein